MTFLGILIGIVVLAAAYGATMCGYFALRRKMPGAKFFVEIVIMGVAVAFSFCVKLTVYMLQEGDNIEDGAAALFFAVYKAVAGLALDGIDSVSQLGGLEHLEGETVSILADGAVQTEKIVQNGMIELDTPAGVVHVGLPFVSVLQTMPLVSIGRDGVSEASTKRISGILLRLYKTLGLSVGSSEHLEKQSFRSSSDPMNAPPALFSGDKKVSFCANWDRISNIRIEQDQPLPLTVLSLFPLVSTNRI